MSENIKVINVFLNTFEPKIKVGRLVYKNRRIYFEYDKEFLQTSLELSPYKLPLKEGVFICEDMVFEGIWGVFNDSLPDGWGRLLTDRHLLKKGINLTKITPLDRLNFVGNFAIGALSYEPVFKLNNVELEQIILDDLAQNSQNILEGSEDLVEELLLLNGSSAGARPKAMIQTNSNYTKIIHGTQKLKEGFSHWMVKFNSALDMKEAGAVEYAYSLMAKDAKIEMPKTTLFRGKKGSYFGCERFDRVGNQRVHIHSLAGLIHSDFRYPTLDYDDLLMLSFNLTKDTKEQIKVFRLACFNLYCHNRDDHSKNFSFLLDNLGRWKFSPAYDITFSNGPAGEHSTMYLGEGKNPTKKHLLELAKKHNIKEGKIICEEVESSISDWSKFAKEANVSQKTEKIITRELE